MLRAIWMPRLRPEIIGLSKIIGEFGVRYTEDDPHEGEILIEIRAPADITDNRLGYFAALHVHYDGIRVLSDLRETGFLARFAMLHANTFYDVMQCFLMSNISVTVHGDSEYEFVNREIYKLLTKEN